METLRFAVIDSTSARARELLASGKSAPFAVVAERQTAGRGRRGNFWESPSGNLYVTFVLPPPAVRVAEAALTPLKAAVCCARVLQQMLGMRVTLKWPNDLLFAGKKIGGLLCETSMTGGTTGEVLVGLGLNTQIAPSLDDGDAPIPAALTEWSAQAIDHDQFISGFWAQWQRLESSQIAQGFAEFSTGIGQPWLEYRGTNADDGLFHNAWTEAGLGESGELVLDPLVLGTEPLRLSSVEHRCTWAYAARGRTALPLVIADCGNSRIKLALFAPAIAVRPSQMWTLAGDASTEEFIAVLGQLRSLLPHAGWPIFMASVNPEAARRLQQLAASLDMRVVSVPKRRVRTHGERYDLAPLGIDRLAALEGAMARSLHHWHVIVSVGTATTVDALRPDGWHAGGWILPGLEIGLMALHRAGRLLPELHAREAMDAPARLGAETRSAMLCGMVQMTVGAIRRASEVLLSEHPTMGRPRLVLTGGDASVLSPHLPEAEVDPWLVLAGIRSMVLGGIAASVSGLLAPETP